MSSKKKQNDEVSTNLKNDKEGKKNFHSEISSITPTPCQCGNEHKNLNENKSK